MHPADIKALIEKAGSSQTDIARSLPGRNGKELSLMTVNTVIHGRGKSRRVAMAISRLTGVPVSRLWPSKYPELEKLQALQAAEARATPKH